MRPIGAIFFGRLADIYGRKKILNLSIILMIAPTICIGLLPTYDDIGIYASIFLSILRLVQGFLCGGEAPVSAVLMMELSAPSQRAFKGGLLCASSLVGALIGLFFSIVCTMEAMPFWSWRLPFLCVVLIGAFGYQLRKTIPESSLYENQDVKKQDTPIPIRKTLFFVGASASSLIPFYLSTVYINQLFYGHLNLSKFVTLNSNAINLLSWMLLLPIAGLISDRIGKHKVMLFSSIAMIILSCLTFSLNMDKLENLIVFQIITLLAGALYVAPFSAYACEQFSTKRRCITFSICTGIGSVLFGACTPLLVNYLSDITPYAIQLYTCFGSIISFLSLLLIQNTKKFSLLIERKWC